MAQTTLILAISIAIAATQFDAAESRLNRLPTNVFLIRTAEAAAAASTGNNLNAARQSFDGEDFQAISTTSFLNDEKSKKYVEGKDKSDSNQANVEENFNSVDPQRLIWDDCLETSFREEKHLAQPQDDLEIALDYKIYSPLDEIRLQDTGPTFVKRNYVNKNNSKAITAWLEKYNNLLNSKAEERRAQKQEPTFNKKGTATAFDTNIPNSTTTAPSDRLTDIFEEVRHTSMVPTFLITRDLFEEPTRLPIVTNVTQNVVTESNVIASYTEDWFDVRNKTKMRFSSLPKRDTYMVPTLRLEEGFYPFSFMSEFFYLIYPFDFPVGK